MASMKDTEKQLKGINKELESLKGKMDDKSLQRLAELMQQKNQLEQAKLNMQLNIGGLGQLDDINAKLIEANKNIQKVNNTKIEPKGFKRPHEELNLKQRSEAEKLFPVHKLFGTTAIKPINEMVKAVDAVKGKEYTDKLFFNIRKGKVDEGYKKTLNSIMEQLKEPLNGMSYTPKGFDEQIAKMRANREPQVVKKEYERGLREYKAEKLQGFSGKASDRVAREKELEREYRKSHMDEYEIESQYRNITEAKGMKSKPVEVKVDTQEIKEEIKQIEKEPVEVKVEPKIAPRVFGDAFTETLENEELTKHGKAYIKNNTYSNGIISMHEEDLARDAKGVLNRQEKTNEEDLKIIDDILAKIKELKSFKIGEHRDFVGGEDWHKYLNNTSTSEQLIQTGKQILMDIATGQFASANDKWANSDMFDTSAGVEYLKSLFSKIEENESTYRAKKQAMEEFRKERPYSLVQEVGTDKDTGEPWVLEYDDITPEDLGAVNTIGEEIDRIRGGLGKAPITVPIDTKPAEKKVEELKETIKETLAPVEEPIIPKVENKELETTQEHIDRISKDLADKTAKASQFGTYTPGQSVKLEDVQAKLKKTREASKELETSIGRAKVLINGEKLLDLDLTDLKQAVDYAELVHKHLNNSVIQNASLKQTEIRGRVRGVIKEPDYSVLGDEVDKLKQQEIEDDWDKYLPEPPKRESIPEENFDFAAYEQEEIRKSMEEAAKLRDNMTSKTTEVEDHGFSFDDSGFDEFDFEEEQSVEVDIEEAQDKVEELKKDISEIEEAPIEPDVKIEDIEKDIEKAVENTEPTVEIKPEVPEVKAEVPEVVSGTSDSGKTAFQENEERMQKPLAEMQQATKNISDFAKNLAKEIHGSMSEYEDNYGNDITEYFKNNPDSILPYGAEVYKDDKGKYSFKVNEDKLADLDEATANLVRALVDKLNILAESQKEAYTGALNRATPNRLTDLRTGELDPDVAKYISLSQTKPEGKEGTDYAEIDVKYTPDDINGNPTTEQKYTGYIKQLAIPENEDLYKGKGGETTLGVWQKTAQERLYGYTDDEGKHKGFSDLAVRLNNASLDVVDLMGQLAPIIPAISQNTDAFMDDGDPTEYRGNGLLKRLTFSRDYADDFEGKSGVNGPQDIKLDMIRPINDFAIDPGQVIEELQRREIKLPDTSQDSLRFLEGKGLSNILEDYKSRDADRIINTKDANEYKIEGYDNLSEESKKMADTVAGIKANIDTSGSSLKSGIDRMDEVLNDTSKHITDPSQRILFGTNYETSSLPEYGGKGGGDRFKKAKSNVNALNKQVDDLEADVNKLVERYSSGNIVSLIGTDETTDENDRYGNHNIIDLIQRRITKVIDDNIKFIQGPEFISSQIQTASGNKMYKPEEIKNRLKGVQDKLLSLNSSGALDSLTSEDNLQTLSEQVKQVEEVKKEKQKAEIGSKLGDNLKIESIRAMTLDKELQARQNAQSSGLLSDKELAENREQIEVITKKLESARAAIDSINKEAEENGISLDNSVNSVKELLDGYQKIANTLGSFSKTNEIMKQLATAPNSGALDAMLSDNKLGFLAGDQGFASSLFANKGLINLLNAGAFESKLTGSMIDTENLRGDELASAKYTNRAYEQLIRETQEIQTGFKNPFATKLDNIRTEDLKKGIKETGEQLDKAKEELEKLEQAGASGETLLRFKEKVRVLEQSLNDMNNQARNANSIGDLRLAFEQSKNLRLNLQNLNDRLVEAQNQAKLNQVKNILTEAKNYRHEQNILRAANGQEPLTSQEEADYYRQRAEEVKNLNGECREYIELLGMMQQAEQRAQQEAQQAADDTARAQQEAIDNVKNRITSILETVKKVADGVNNAVNKVIDILRQGLQLINKVISGTVNFIGKLGNGIKSIVSIFGNLANRVRGNNNEFNIFKKSATELKSKIDLLSGAINKLFNNEAVKHARQLLSSILAMNSIIGKKLTTNTIEWAIGMEKAFGLRADNLIADLNELTGVLYGLGMKGEDVASGSENLLVMSRYLGMMGLAGGDVSTVMSKLVSGMKGMTASIDDLGISVRDSQMNQFLKDLKAQGGEFANIATDFSSLNEEARVYIRYAAIIEQFTKRYGKLNQDTGKYELDPEKFVDILNSVTGRINLLKDSFDSMTSTFGAGIFKIASLFAGYLLPILNSISNWIVDIFARLSNFTGINFNIALSEDIGTLDFNAEEQTDKADELAESLEEVSEKAKEAKGSLQGFDRVNNVSTNTGAAGSEFDYAKLIDGMGKLFDPIENDYGNFLAQIEDKNKEYTEKLKTAILGWAEEITGRDLEWINFESISENLKTALDNTKKLLSTVFTDISSTLIKIMDDINLGKILEKFSELIKVISEVALEIWNILKPAFDVFYDSTLKPVFEKWGENVVKNIDWVISKVELLPDIFKEASEDGFSFEKLKESAAGTVWETLINLAIELGNVFNALKPIVKDLVGIFAEFVKEELLPWLVEKLGQLAKWLTENKDQIIAIVEKLGGIAWEGFKIFVDLVGKLIDFVVKNPDTVVKFLGSLLALKVGSWFVSMAAGLALAAVGLAAFDKILKGTSLGALFGIGGGATAGGAAAGGGILSSLTTTLTNLGTKVLGLLSVKLAVILAVIIALIAAFVDLWKTTESFREFFINLGNSIKEHWDALVNRFKGNEDDAELGLFESLKVKLGELWEKIKELGGALYEVYERTLKPVFKDIFEILGVVGTSLINALIDVLGALVAFISNTLSGAIDILIGLFDILVALFTLKFGEGFEEKFIEGFKRLVYGIVDVISGITALIGEAAGAIISFVLDIFVGIGNKICEGFGTGIKQGWENFVKRTAELWEEYIQWIKDIFGIHSPSTVFADIGVNIVQGLLNGIVNTWSTLSSKVSELCNNLISGIRSSIQTGWNNITTWVDEKKQSLSSGWDNAKNYISTGWENLTNRTKANTGRNIFGFANGGSVAGGQLFVANENGTPELIGQIKGVKGTNVANNNMIVEAMKAGVFEAVYNANAEIANQTRGNSMNSGNANIKIEGFGLIDQSTLRELARMLAPYMNSNSKNIADVNFTI